MAAVPPAIRPATPRDLLKLVALGAVWGSSFIFIELALDSFGPLTITAARVSLAGVALWIVARLTGHRFPVDRHSWMLLVLIGTLNSAVPFFLISWGEQHISSGQTAVLMATGSFVTLILSHYFTRDDRLHRNKVIGMLLGFGGVVVLIGPQALAGTLTGLAGQLAAIAAACSYATAAVLTRYLRNVAPLVSGCIAMLSAAVYMVPLALLLEPLEPGALTTQPLLALVFLSLVSTAAAFVLRFQIIQQVGATFMTQVSYLVPLFGVLWSWLFLDEQIGTSMAVALILILAGINFSRLRRAA